MSASSSGPTSRVSRLISASPEEIFAALVDQSALEIWQAPDAMTAKVHEFDLRVGGGYRMSLYYPDTEPASIGKSAAREDRFSSRFVSIASPHRVVQAIRFDSADPANQGEMTMAITLAPETRGTLVTFEFQNLPPGVRPEDNDAGTRSSLEKLSRYVESSS